MTVPEIEIGDPAASGEDRVQAPGADTFEETANSRSDSDTATARSVPRSPYRKRNDAGAWLERIQIPRWVIYVQGALLGIVATTFFIFGLAVGNNTSGVGRPGIPATTDCVVSGRVYYDQGPERRADFGAVIILLPADKVPRERPDASGLRPVTFEPINNPAIETIRGLGGSVVRTDQDGKFETDVSSGKSYWLLVISRNQTASNASIGKQTRSELGAYFFPIEDVLDDRAFQWSKVRISGAEQELRTVTF
ncbi:MAG: hypothetical protein ACR2NP_10260 [Pirellulaceae bacterium]